MTAKWDGDESDANLFSDGPLRLPRNDELRAWLRAGGLLTDYIKLKGVENDARHKV
jgi:hypothetical protein